MGLTQAHPNYLHVTCMMLTCYIKWSTAVVVHFNYHIWVDPPGREERRREGRWRKER